MCKFLLVLVIATALPLGKLSSAVAQDTSRRVVGITDGDTITVVDANNTQSRIRLAGIDAPERHQAYGEASKQNLVRLIFNKSILIASDKRDRYGRIVAKIMLNGRDINLTQIQQGMAWHYKQYQTEQTPNDRQLYSEAEYSARIGKVGIWHDKSPIPPWMWRKAKKGK